RPEERRHPELRPQRVARSPMSIPAGFADAPCGGLAQNRRRPVANELVPAAGPAALVASGLFPDLKTIYQAQIKIAAGRALGLDPVTSAALLHLIKGRVVMSAQLMAALIKRGGKYDYAVLRLDPTGCELVFSQGGREIGRSAFTEEDARRAGLTKGDNYRSFPEDMFFARALSRGARRFCPDAL